MIVYVVFYYDDCQEAWAVGNVYSNRKEADKEARIYDGYVLAREIL